MKFDYLIVGAGFAGSTCARMLAEQGSKVLVVDKRKHVGGNAYDEHDENGYLIHKYGAHIFHTNSEKVFAFLSRFTEWNSYEHRVLTSVKENLYPFPINLTTLSKFFGRSIGEEEAQLLVADKCKELYEAFFEGYTRKQWGKWWSQLDDSVLARVAPRMNDDDRYFTDKFQFMPAAGYTAMFNRMLDHGNIWMDLGVPWSWAKREPRDRLIFTGPVDEYYDYRHGALPYRSLSFYHMADAHDSFQDAAVVNYPNGTLYTRIIEHKKITGQKIRGTVVTFEYPQDAGEPYYPVPCAASRELYAKYKALADAETSTFFCGRLGTYRYYNMDQVVAQAMKLVEKIA